MRPRTIVLGIAVVVAAFVAATFAMQTLWPSFDSRRPTLAKVAPLPPLVRTSVIVAPTVIALTAIRDVLDAHAPRSLSGKRENPVSKLLSKADIGFTVTRGP